MGLFTKGSLENGPLENKRMRGGVEATEIQCISSLLGRPALSLQRPAGTPLMATRRLALSVARTRPHGAATHACLPRPTLEGMSGGIEEGEEDM